MRPLLLYVMLPLTAMAATAIPTDPARAASTPCPRAAAVTSAQKAEQKPQRAETKRQFRKLEAL